MEALVDIISKIRNLKRGKDAVILAHNYQIPEVQEIADFVGDSLELAKIAKTLKERVVVLCGVYFMAETISILAPDKTVLIPDLNAGCPLADSITLNELEKLKAEHPKALVIAYINTSAEIKALSDYCCTSANAIKVEENVPSDEVIFIPDKNLGSYVKEHTEKRVYLSSGFCPSHNVITAKDVQEIKQMHPDAKFVAHPECRKEVLELADKIASTTGMIKYVQESNSKKFIIGTEEGIIYKLKKENPTKEFYTFSKPIFCPNMKKITLEKVLSSLENMQYIVKVQDGVREKARLAIERMFEI
jgi:quinolinate synthase